MRAKELIDLYISDVFEITVVHRAQFALLYETSQNTLPDITIPRELSSGDDFPSNSKRSTWRNQSTGAEVDIQGSSSLKIGLPGMLW